MSTYTPIATQILNANTASVTFSSIPQNYTDLVFVANMRSSKNTSTSDTTSVRFNNDSGSNYSNTNLYGISSVVTNRRSNDAQWFSGEMASDTATANVYTPIIYNIMNYANTTTFKTIINRGSNTTEPYVGTSVCLYRSTSAITAITIYPANGDFVAGSSFNLYGIAEGGGYALGGDIVTTDGTYWYHTFLSSGAFTPTKALTVDYLVVAGGGGGSHAGGGGAGGYRTSAGTSGGNSSAESALSLNAQTYQVLIGGGGAGGASTVVGKGTDSVFASITSEGGGGGAYRGGGLVGGNGGSGGGSGSNNSGGARAGGTATANQGSNGGSYTGSGDSGSGGGGAGATGSSNSGNNGGNGGNGLSSSISGSAVTRGGGGGGSSAVGTVGTGGTGGGGAAGSNTGSTGTINTGGGGGAGWGVIGVAGGSGIVIVRYAV
jgi:hypothetical protein